MRVLRGLAGCEQGAAVIEMALVAPLLAAMLIGMVDLSRAYSAKLQLEQAAQRTIERVMQQRNVPSDYSTILVPEAAAAAGVEASAVTVDNWLECDGARQSSSITSCNSGQTYARYVTVDITKTYTPMFSTRFAGANTDGTYTLRGRAGVRVQ